jgi:Soluble NSF attachment protein, SNAP
MLNKLTSSSAKDLFFKASLLLLVLDDPVGSETILNRCIDKDPGYGNSREAKFVQGIINAIHKRDPDGFATEWYGFYFEFYKEID